MLIEVVNTVPDAIAPVVTILSPAPGSSGTVITGMKMNTSSRMIL